MIYQIDPLSDVRYPELVRTHPQACAFHTRAWLEALRQTYGYVPIAFTTSPPQSALECAVVFCRVDSWLTGSRLVSLPFSDHCEPLVQDYKDSVAILQSVAERIKALRLRYIEIRPLNCGIPLDRETGFGHASTFRFHELRLEDDLDSLFLRFHKDSIQRRVKHCERIGLTYEVGNSIGLLRQFYHLLVLTRKRHHIPPQPFRWFENLLRAMGSRLLIRVLSSNEVPVASIMTMEHNGRVIYKYGSSDSRFKHLGATPTLFWRAIQDAKAAGAYVFDMGRSDLDNTGLIAFKSKWAASDQALKYWRYPGPTVEHSSLVTRAQRMSGRLISRLPEKVLIPASRFLYRHAG